MLVDADKLGRYAGRWRTGAVAFAALAFVGFAEVVLRGRGLDPTFSEQMRHMSDSAKPWFRRTMRVMFDRGYCVLVAVGETFGEGDDDDEREAS